MSNSESERMLSRGNAKSLAAGSDHYTAYVGPPKQYDFMGATQFRLLTTLGMRENHRVLDFGCGSLRAGRLLIPYLNENCYFGIDPNEWLVRDAIRNEVGQHQIEIKRPSFDSNSDFRMDVFGVEFDFIVAQSIFSHTSPALVLRVLNGFREVAVATAVIACTFIEVAESEAFGPGDEWIYPGCVGFTREEIADFFDKAGLSFVRIPWYHPRQTWYLAAAHGAWLPTEDSFPHLSGAVLNSPEFTASLEPRQS